LPILIVTYIGLVAGMFVVSAFQKINLFKLPFIIFILGIGGGIFALWYWRNSLPTAIMKQYIGFIGAFVIVSIVVLFVSAAAYKKLNVYDLFIDGAKEGFKTAIGIVPYLVAMLVAIAVFRSSGCMQFILDGIAF